MKNVDAFVDLCKRVILEYATGSLDMHLAAEKIYKHASAHTFEDDVHPMLNKVSDLSFDITEDYRTDSDDKADWDAVIKTIKNYDDGNWEPTCWILTAMYGEYSGEKVTHSCSVVARRQNGETIIETASATLKAEFNQISEKINDEQTDERYLRNLAKFTPTIVGEYKHMSIEIAEYLTEPYYSTA